MDTQTSVPEHIKVGGFVRVAEWCGRVTAVFQDTNGRTLVEVESPKQIYRHGRAEWLEFYPDNPTLIKPATFDEYARDVRRYAELAMQDTLKIIKMLGEQ